MKAWPEPAVLHKSNFKKKGKYGSEEKIDMKALELMPAWLKKLHDAHYEMGDDDDAADLPPGVEHDLSEELERDRKNPVPENFAAYQQRKRDEAS